MTRMMVVVVVALELDRLRKRRREMLYLSVLLCCRHACFFLARYVLH